VVRPFPSFLVPPYHFFFLSRYLPLILTNCATARSPPLVPLHLRVSLIILHALRQKSKTGVNPYSLLPSSPLSTILILFDLNFLVIISFSGNKTLFPLFKSSIRFSLGPFMSSFPLRPFCNTARRLPCERPFLDCQNHPIDPLPTRQVVPPPSPHFPTRISPKYCFTESSTSPRSHILILVVSFFFSWTKIQEGVRASLRVFLPSCWLHCFFLTDLSQWIPRPTALVLFTNRSRSRRSDNLWHYLTLFFHAFA